MAVLGKYPLLKRSIVAVSLHLLSIEYMCLSQDLTATSVSLPFVSSVMSMTPTKLGIPFQRYEFTSIVCMCLATYSLLHRVLPCWLLCLRVCVVVLRSGARELPSPFGILG